MSVKVMNAVFDRFPEGGGIMVLALKLADHAHDDGTHVYPSIPSLALKTRQSDRTVQRQIERMVKAGWLIMVSGNRGGRGVTTEYRISPEWLAGEDISFDEKGDILSSAEKGDISDKKGDIQSVKGDIHDKKGDTAMSPEQSYNHQEQSENQKQAAGADGLLLPTWLPAESWSAFLAMRKKIRKPLTDYAIKLAVSKLTELRSEGNDPARVLDQSTLNCWQGLFPVRDEAVASGAARVNRMPTHYGESGVL